MGFKIICLRFFFPRESFFPAKYFLNRSSAKVFSREIFENGSSAKVFSREIQKFRGWADPRKFLPAKVF